eukprot:gnl/Dysnectes_brevis/3547_a4507_1144.p1 GENE.gnl/Dysnectes_brevis/3547_a4507_1144~~gnl/Dysnectes_brevis/3547_a4507_1144.p1  ORF type:complete len:198 (-),score=11.59 gnl/Dysnectes_brevis/3547_a4507_1144:14-607(-)
MSKVVLLGSASAGKTSLLIRVSRKAFHGFEPPTLVSSFTSLKSADGSKSISIWDTAGQERFSSISQLYYRDAVVALIVFDATDLDSLARAKKYLILVTRTVPSCHLLLVANKQDLLKDLPDRQRIELARKSQSLADSHRCQLVTVSAKLGNGVDELFEKVFVLVDTPSTRTLRPGSIRLRPLELANDDDEPVINTCC